MKLGIMMAGMALSAAVFAAGELDTAVLHGETDKARAIDYAPGEEMTFTISLQGEKPFDKGTYFVSWKRTGDDGETKSGKIDAKDLPLTVKTKIDKPGFVRVEAQVLDAKGNVYRKKFQGDTTTPEGRAALNKFERNDKRVFFDGGAGVQIDTLQSVPEPKDFDEFWAKRKARLAKVPMKAIVQEQPSSNPKVKVYTFSCQCAGPQPVTGTYTVPVKPGKYPASIGFHGYGAAYVQEIPKSGAPDRIHMSINAHGYELGREPEYYREFYNSIKHNGENFALDTAQNKNADTAYFGWMTYRIMRALQYLKSLPQWDGKNLSAGGGSMGGLQTIWAAALDPDVTVANASIPWCCDMGGRETLKRNGIGWGVHETEAMRYFDPVNMAKRISKNCFVNITRAGLGDYCCPPSGVAILYNNLPCRKRILWIQGSTHPYVPSEKHQEFTLEAEAK